MLKKEIPYSIVDVFTDKLFLGNPVAVIRDGTALSRDEMLSIAKEFGFSETTFILPPKNESSDANIRIFTPITEIPFAGHPNIGTAYVIATQDSVIVAPSTDILVFDELGGSVTASLVKSNGEISGAKILSPQPLSLLGQCSPKLIADCLNVSQRKLLGSRFSPCVASVGLPFAFVEIADLETLSNIELDISSFRNAKETGPQTVDGFAICAFVVQEEFENAIELRSRVFSPLGVPPEDPATGSASGALAALLAPNERKVVFRVDIEQGVEMGRASKISVNMAANSDLPEISGDCVGVSKGVLYL